MAWKIADRTGKIFIDHNMNRLGREHRGRVLAAARAASAGLDAAHVGRGLRGRVRAERLPDRQRVGAVRARRRPVRRRAHRGGGPHVGAGGARGRPRAVDGAAAQPAVDAPLPRTAAKAVAARTAEEIAAASKDPALFEYVRRREFGPEGTTEPAPGEVTPSGNSFVIHKHRATRLHYDVRLEQRRGPAVVGGAQGPADRQRRQAARGADRGAPARVRAVRGHDPRRPLRRGRGAHLRRRLVRAGRVDRHEGLVRAARPALPRPRVPLREDEDRLARVPRERAVGAADPDAPAVRADARRGRMGAVRRRRPGGSSRSSTASGAWPSSRPARRCFARAPGATRPSSTRSCTWCTSSSTR